ERAWRDARVARAIAADDAQGAHPHQQHEPDSRRGFAAAGRARAPRRRSRLGWHGDRAVNARVDTRIQASVAAPQELPPWSREEFEARLQAQGSAYHIYHPFNVMLNTGKAQPEQIRGWVANRFYYQISIPIKDAAILSNCPDRTVRRAWVQRILDHDGYDANPSALHPQLPIP